MLTPLVKAVKSRDGNPESPLQQLCLEAPFPGGYNASVGREELLKKLAALLPTLRERFGVESLYLFGSMARDEASPKSDVDLLVRFAQPPGFLGYMRLKIFLEEELGRKVDLVTEGSLRPELRPIVEREALKVA